MTWMKKNWLLLAVLLVLTVNVLRGQTLAPPEEFVDSTQTVATCIVKPNYTAYCKAFEGPAVSINGAPFVKIPLTVAPTGVTSFNGRTGAVMPVPSDYPNAVTSVNGKTGVVVLTATAPTIQ